MGDFLVKTISDFLKDYLNKEIPNEEFVFRRVPLNIFLDGRPIHRLDISTQIFRNEKGGGMSIDWERICNDPKETQTRGGKDLKTHGVVVLSVYDIKKHNEYLLRVINDQNDYPCHCIVRGIPMSLNQLRKFKKKEFKKLSSIDKSSRDSLLLAIREYLRKNAFWVIPLRSSRLKDPPPEFNYNDKFTERIEEFFTTRQHPIPS
ncbi:hypothetical protein ES703_87480 [subsurface metagenome]